MSKKTDTSKAHDNITADHRHGSWRVEDRDGGIWHPGETAAVEIDQADDPAAHAVHVCRTQPMRGEWSQQ